MWWRNRGETWRHTRWISLWCNHLRSVRTKAWIWVWWQAMELWCWRSRCCIKYFPPSQINVILDSPQHKNTGDLWIISFFFFLTADGWKYYNTHEPRSVLLSRGAHQLVVWTEDTDCLSSCTVTMVTGMLCGSESLILCFFYSHFSGLKNMLLWFLSQIFNITLSCLMWETVTAHVLCPLIISTCPGLLQQERGGTTS